MSFEVKALYDFQGEPNTAELSIVAGETLKIIRTDVGEGWWEGVNSTGKSGLLPEAYVERKSSEQPPPVPYDNASTALKSPDDWDDDWDDDTYSEIAQNEAQPYNVNEQMYANEINENYSIGDSELGNRTDDNKGTVSKKSLNRFSSFVKNGGENYLLGALKIHVSDDLRIRITEIDDNIYAWPPITNAYTVQVTSPKKETKLKGLKSFIAYQLTPSFNNIQVSRRYKHFDWLHERLSEKFSLLSVPPLPDKQISGRYEEQFIEHRRIQLQEFVDYVCRHPVMSRCEVWQHFLTCTDEKLWKIGKRTAEKDQLIGAGFCLCIEAPDKTLLPSVAENLETINVHFINGLDAAIKNMMLTSVDTSKKYRTIYGKDHHRIGTSFYQLGTAIEQDNKAIPCRMAQIVKYIGAAYTDIGDLYEKQTLKDWEPLSDKLYIYKGITTSFQVG